MGRRNFIAATAALLPVAAAALDPPTAAEIHQIESRIDMPSGADPLDQYFRYYYVDTEQETRTIGAGYVAKRYIEPSKLPANPIVIVGSYEDVPAWYDAGCGIVRVSFTPQLSEDVSARCDPALELFPPSSIPSWMYALIPLAPIAALIWFGITRWLPAVRARRARVE